MHIDVITSATSSEERRPQFPPHLRELSAQSIQAADAVVQITSLFQAYQGLEKLAMPRGAKAVDLSLSDREIYALLAALNEPMKRHIDEAQVACNRLLTSIQQERTE